MSTTLRTTVATLTPVGRGAVAVVLVRGVGAMPLVSRFFAPRNASAWKRAAVGRVFYGRWTNGRGDDGGACEDVIVCRTKEDAMEIHSHGGIASLRIVDDLASAGAEKCDWKALATADGPNAIRAAARIALAEATTERTAGILLDQFNGALESEVRRIAESLEGDRTRALADLQTLLERGTVGLHLTEPWRVVVAGPPNVGKSSLVNAILGYERALVFDQPGTTRDIVVARTSLVGWPVSLVDTAGLRTTTDQIEIEGIELARRAANKANCVVVVFDATQPWTDECDRTLHEWPGAIVVCNKVDLQANAAAMRPGCITTSALLGTGIDQLARAIVARLIDVELQFGDPVPFRESQLARLEAAKNLIGRGELQAGKSVLLALLESD